jgi:hypothetical protein
MAASGLCVLTSDPKAPEVGRLFITKIWIFICFLCRPLARTWFNILLLVQEPVWYLVLVWILYNPDHMFSSSLVRSTSTWAHLTVIAKAIFRWPLRVLSTWKMFWDEFRLPRDMVAMSVEVCRSHRDEALLLLFFPFCPPCLLVGNHSTNCVD